MEVRVGGFGHVRAVGGKAMALELLDEVRHVRG